MWWCDMFEYNSTKNLFNILYLVLVHIVTMQTIISKTPIKTKNIFLFVKKRYLCMWNSILHVEQYQSVFYLFYILAPARNKIKEIMKYSIFLFMFIQLLSTLRLESSAVSKNQFNSPIVSGFLIYFYYKYHYQINRYWIILW